MRLSSRVATWFDWRRKSPLRGIFIAIPAVIFAARLSHFPTNNPTLWLVIPVFLVLIALADTVRCMLGRWSWYHGGVLLIIYMELMALTLVLFFLVYPYWV